MALMEKYAFRNCTVKPDPVLKSRVVVEGPCVYCGNTRTIRVKKADLEKFRGGDYAQVCFDYLTAGEREFLISGICDPCWDEYYGEEDEVSFGGEDE